VQHGAEHQVIETEMSASTLTSHEVAEATVEGPHGQIPFRLFKTEVCFTIVHEIFAGNTYPHVPFVTGVETIFDIGANIGAASFYFATCHPSARVYAFEPASLPFSLLRQNVAPVPNISVFPFGLFSCEKTLALYGGREDSVESSVYPSGRTSSEAEEIQLQPAGEFLDRQRIKKIDILKLDTEGCEVPILRALREYLPAVKVIYVEYHSDRDRRLIDALLAATHVLWRGQVSLVHRGEFCYLNRTLVPDESETHTCEILLPLD
jgi:FkbM family methyltransferase